ncbi:MAG: hypothetical protein IJW23_11365 [Lentisphaeria bacterium]|nr:hypothetical protein [Lentisphaeria bacterium]
MRKLLLAAGLLFCSAAALYANMREVSFYCARPAKIAPVLDGKLDDPCWQNVPEFTSTYEYFKPNPGPGKLKNSIRIVYTDQGLYMGIIHYVDNPKEIRATVTDRDNGSLWTDDCTEIYIDADAQAIGWRKFVVNTLNTVSDIWRIDSAVLREDWTADGWEVKTLVTENSWNLETFFPWSVFNKRAVPGDTWMYCHVRYAWGGGKFTGTTSSPGGNYCSTSNFGYLYFATEDQKIDLDGIAQMLGSKIAPPWCLSSGQDVIINEGKGIVKTTLNAMISKEKRAIEESLSVRNVPKKYLAQKEKLQKEYAAILKTMKPSIQMARSLNSLARLAQEYKWGVMLENEFNNK